MSEPLDLKAIEALLHPECAGDSLEAPHRALRALPKLLAALRETREAAKSVSQAHANGIIAGYDAAVNDLRAVLAKVRDE